MSQRVRLRHRSAAAIIGVLLAGAAALAVPAGVASAHDPIILTDQQTTPEAGPLLLDGTVSFALYGTIEAPGETRGFRVRFAEGDTFVLSALVPDLLPENGLAPGDLPTVTVRSPSGAEQQLEPGEVVGFDEPFTGTSYLRYLEWSTVAEAGDYGVTISGTVPARFTVSVGVEERFGTAVEDVPNRELGVAGVMEWYGTPPPSAPPPPPAATDAPSTTAQRPPTSTTAAPSTSAASSSTTTTVEEAVTPTSDQTTASTVAPPASGGAGTAEDSDDDAGLVAGVIALCVAAIAVAGAAIWWRRRRR